MTDRKQISQFIFLTFLTGILFYICWQMLAPFISILLWSSILVIIFYPLYRKLRLKIKNHTISALITIFISLLIFIIPLIVVSAAAINEIAGISDASIEELKNIFVKIKDNRFAFINSYLNGMIDIEKILKPEDIKAFLARMSELILSASLSFVEGIFGMLVGIVISVFVMFYLLRDGEKIVSDIPGIMPMDNYQAKLILSETTALIDATIRGTMFIALIQGTLAGIIFWLLGIPSFLLLGFLAMLFSLIPTGGTAFVTVPVIIILLFTGEYGKAGILSLYAAIVIGMIDNFLLPQLIKQKVKMNELFVFFSVIGGLQVFGILGLFMGPIVLAITLGVFKVFRGVKIDKEAVTM